MGWGPGEGVVTAAHQRKLDFLISLCEAAHSTELDIDLDELTENRSRFCQDLETRLSAISDL